MVEIPELQTTERTVINRRAKHFEEDPNNSIAFAVDTIVVRQTMKARGSAIGATRIPLNAGQPQVPDFPVIGMAQFDPVDKFFNESPWPPYFCARAGRIRLHS
jgi:hypothetical protein